MATVIYPQQGQGLGDLISLINAGTGIGGLIQKIRMDRQARGLNIDDTEIPNDFRGEMPTEMTAPTSAMSPIQKLIANTSPEVLEGQARYRALESLTPRGSLSDEGFNKLFTPGANETVRTDPNDKISRAQREYVQGTNPLSPSSPDRKITAPIRGFDDAYKKEAANEFQYDIKQKQDLAKEDSAVREYQENKKLVEQWKKQPDSFKGNAAQLHSQIREASNKVINFNAEKYINTGEPIYLNRAANDYEKQILSHQTVDKIHGFPSQYGSRAQFISLLQARRQGGGTGGANTEQWSMNGKQFNLRKGLSQADAENDAYNQYKEALVQRGGTPLNKKDWFDRENVDKRGLVRSPAETEATRKQAEITGMAQRDIADENEKILRAALPRNYKKNEGVFYDTTVKFRSVGPDGKEVVRDIKNKKDADNLVADAKLKKQIVNINGEDYTEREYLERKENGEKFYSMSGKKYTAIPEQIKTASNGTQFVKIGNRNIPVE